MRRGTAVGLAVLLVTIGLVVWRTARSPDPLAGPYRVVIDIEQPVGARVLATLDVDDRSQSEERIVPCKFTVTGSKIAFKVTKLDETKGPIWVTAGGYGIGAVITDLHSDPREVSGRVKFKVGGLHDWR